MTSATSDIDTIEANGLRKASEFKTHQRYFKFRYELSQMLACDWVSVEPGIGMLFKYGPESSDPESNWIVKLTDDSAAFINTAIARFNRCDHPQTEIRATDEVRVQYLLRWISRQGFGLFVFWIPWAIEQGYLPLEFKNLFTPRNMGCIPTGKASGGDKVTQSIDPEDKPLTGMGKRTYLRLILKMLEQTGIDVATTDARQKIHNLLSCDKRTLDRLLHDLRVEKNRGSTNR